MLSFSLHRSIAKKLHSAPQLQGPRLHAQKKQTRLLLSQAVVSREVLGRAPARAREAAVHLRRAKHEQRRRGDPEEPVGGL